MRYRVELSTDAQKQLFKFPRDVRERIEHAIDELEAKDDSEWSNVKALQGDAWKGRYRKKLGPYVSYHLQEVPRPQRGGNLCDPHQVKRHLPIEEKLRVTE